MENYSKIVEWYKLFKEDKKLLEVFYTNDYAIPYKDLVFYPIKIDMWYFYNIFAESLKVPQIASGDIKAISMSYLEYIYYLASEKNKVEILFMLGQILLLALHENETYTDENGKEKQTIDFIISKKELRIKDNYYNAKDFNMFREIILTQNGDEIPDETIDSELLEEYYKKLELDNKMSKYKSCKFEDNINILVCLTSYTRENVFNLTIRSFKRLLERASLVLDYKIQTMLLPYMDKKGKDSIVPYTADTYKTLKEKIFASMGTLNDIEKMTK